MNEQLIEDCPLLVKHSKMQEGTLGLASHCYTRHLVCSRTGSLIKLEWHLVERTPPSGPKGPLLISCKDQPHNIDYSLRNNLKCQKIPSSQNIKESGKKFLDPAINLNWHQKLMGSILGPSSNPGFSWKSVQ